MSKDKPARNPQLNPAGLPPAESSRHRHIRPGTTPGVGSETQSSCRFVSSEGGTKHCSREPYMAGFCRFHHRCLVKEEITAMGKIRDCVKDQARRREINLYGQELPHHSRLADDPITGR